MKAMKSHEWIQRSLLPPNHEIIPCNKLHALSNPVVNYHVIMDDAHVCLCVCVCVFLHRYVHVCVLACDYGTSLFLCISVFLLP